MILRTHTLPCGRVVALASSAYGYRVTLADGATVLVGRDFAPRSRARAFERFLELAAASPAGEAFYPEALHLIARASAGLSPSRLRSLADGALGAVLHSGREGAAPAARALRRLAEETGDTAVAGLATRVASLHAAMVLALPADVRAPLDAEIGARP